jgi:hypothetical protein
MGDIYKKAADRDDVCTTVVLPTLNEAETLPKVVEELRAAGYDKILVVDGGSTDGTLEKAKELGVAAVMQIGKGKGMALRTALMYVDTPYVAVMDADYSYPPLSYTNSSPTSATTNWCSAPGKAPCRLYTSSATKRWPGSSAYSSAQTSQTPSRACTPRAPTC